MKAFKRLLTIVIAATVILFCVISVVAAAESYNNLSYKIENGEAKITSCSNYATIVNIPSEIDGYPVTSISKKAFYNRDKLVSVTIPDTVTEIGERAFYGCRALKEITIGENIKSIGKLAFADCFGLTAINWNAAQPDSIGKHIFSGAGTEGLGVDVIFGEKVQSIPDYLFFEYPFEEYGYTINYITPKIKSVTISDSAKSIGMYTFLNCTELKTVKIGNSVEHIGQHAFASCSGLTDITIPDSVTSIGIYAFSGCTGLTSITIPRTIKHINDYTFHNCDAITDVNFKGTEQEWQNITINRGNDTLLRAKPQAKFILGDVNGDNQITAEDARLALRLSAGLETLEKLNETVDGVDYNMDGQITAEDARRILRKSAGLE